MKNEELMATSPSSFFIFYFSLLTNPAFRTFRQFPTEPLLHQLVQPVFQGFHADVLDNVGSEGHAEQHPSLLAGNSSALHIEQGVLVELAGRHPVRTLHIVGIYLQLGFAIHPCLAGSTKIAIRLVRLGFIGSLLHIDATGKRADGMVVQDILK